MIMSVKRFIIVMEPQNDQRSHPHEWIAGQFPTETHREQDAIQIHKRCKGLCKLLALTIVNGVPRVDSISEDWIRSELVSEKEHEATIERHNQRVDERRQMQEAAMQEVPVELDDRRVLIIPAPEPEVPDEIPTPSNCISQLLEEGFDRWMQSRESREIDSLFRTLRR